MVLNTIKYLLTGDNSSAEKEYNKILKNLSLSDENPEHKDEIKESEDIIKVLKKRFLFSKFFNKCADSININPRR